MIPLKKYLCLVLCVAVLAGVFCGCVEIAEHPTTQALTETTDALVTDNVDFPVPPEVQYYGVQYIRTDGYHAGTQYPIVEIIRSPEALSSYYEAKKELYSLERRENPASDFTVGFLDACDAYDEGFFETGYLLLVLLEEGSGSNRHKVDRVTQEAGKLAVHIQRLVPEVGTDDMAQWHIILEMNSLMQVQPEDVQIYLDGRLAYADSEAQPPMLEAEYTQPPTLTLVHPQGEQKALWSSCHWFYPLQDGVETAVIGCGRHPLESQIQPLPLAGVPVKLNFALTPDSVVVQCWQESDLGNVEAKGEMLFPEDGILLNLKPENCMYEITAVWDAGSNSCHGSVKYLLRTCQPDEHTHESAPQPQSVEEPFIGYCGNTQTKLYVDGQRYDLWGGDSVTLTDLLLNLAYDPNMLCNCLPEFTVDTEFGTGYGVNLTEFYVRSEKGQASLTEEQVQTVRAILNRNLE